MMRILLLVIAALVVIGAVLIVPVSGHAAAFAYLVSYIVGVTTVLGVLIIMMVCDACGAVWFILYRRMAEDVISAVPLLAVLFIPIVLMLDRIYPWAGRSPGDAHAHAQALITARRVYLNPTAFTVRAAVVFACWIVIAELLRWYSLRQDQVPAIDLSSRRRAIASIGLIPVSLAATIAAVDWLMSLDTTWASTIVGLQMLVGAFTAGTCLIILLAYVWRRHGSIQDSGEHRHALGLMLFTGVILWMYLAFMQFLVVWMGDMPDEAAWYVTRLAGGWGVVALVMVLLHFVIPFGMLLPRSTKRDATTLAVIASLVLGGHVIDCAWTILPAAGAWQPDVPWLLLVGVAGITASLALAVRWRSRGSAPVPSADPDLVAARAYRRDV